jgi:hypothetical protein
LIQSGITTSSQIINGLAFSNTYYWRVCGITSNGGMSGWSSISHFSTTNSGPTPITPVSSVSQTVTFAWDSVSGATTYALQVAKDSNFVNNIVYNQSNIPTTTQIVSNLTSGTVYYWRVNATSLENGTGVWSIVSRMVTISTTPVPISPVNNGSNMPLTDTLRWNNVVEAVSYSVQISSDSSFANAMMYTVSRNTQIVTGLENNTVYYWRINVTNQGGTSIWSSMSRFTTIIAPPSAPLLSGTLNSPNSNTLSLILSWDTVATASIYTLQLATDSAFTKMVYNQSGLTATSQIVSGLASNLTYYWRVNAANAGGTSSWSIPEFIGALNPLKIKNIITAELPKTFALQKAIYSSKSSVISVSFAVPLTHQIPLLSIKVFDLRGRQIATILNTWISAGYHSVDIELKNTGSSVLGTGKYICIMKAPQFKQSGFLSIVK